MLHLVVDTNVLTGERPFSTSAYLRALEATRAEHIRLVVPELVIREIANRWARSVADNERAITQAHRKLTRAGVDIADLPDAVDVGRLQRSLIATAREQVEEAGALVAPLPAVSHDDVVERALDRRQPFDTAGHNGYRDALLWETVLELLREGHDVMLVSKDRAAFSAGRKTEGVLAEVLRYEAQEAAGRPDAVSLAHDLSTALEAVADSDDDVKSRFETLLDNDDFIMDLDHSLARELEDYGLDQSALEDALGLPPGLVDARITERWSDEYFIEDLEVTHARHASGSTLLLELRVTRLQSIELRFATFSAESVMTVLDLADPELDDEQGLFRGTTTALCVTRADVRVDEAAKSVVDVAITAVEVIRGS